MALAQVSTVFFAQQAPYPKTVSDVFGGIILAYLPVLSPAFPLMSAIDIARRNPEDVPILCVWSVQSTGRA